MNWKLGTLTTSRHGIYYLRQLTSKNLRERLPGLPREIRWSLRTTSRSEAVQRAPYVWAIITEIVEMLTDTNHRKPMSSEEAVAFLHEQLAELRAKKDLELALRELRARDRYVRAIQRLAPPGFDVSKVIGHDGKIASVTPSIASAAGQSISEVVTAFVEQRTQEEAWKPKTLSENRAIFDLFIRIVGDIPFSNVRGREMGLYQQTLQKLPANINKVARYRDRTIQEILSMSEVSPMSLGNVNKSISRIRSLFAWAVPRGYTDRNYAEGVNVRVKECHRKQRSVFTADDLRLLLTSKEYLGRHAQPHRFWTPLLAMFTGARLNELCQLQVSDVGEENGIAYISIDDGFERRLKNEASRRRVPIHPMLLKLGFDRFVKVRQGHAGRDGALFHELRPGRDGHGQLVSKWFAHYKVRCGIKDDTKVFHSFRHTVADCLKQKGVSESHTAALLGHSNDGITYARYGKAYALKVLLDEAVSKIEYDVDLSHLFSTKNNPYYLG